MTDSKLSTSSVDTRLREHALSAALTLKVLTGDVRNATDAKLTIYQDDATHDFIVLVGNRRYWGNSLYAALTAALEDRHDGL